MTIAALQRLLDEEQPDVRRPPAPPIPHRNRTARETTAMQPPATADEPVAEPLPPQSAQQPLPVDQLLAWADNHPDQDVQDQSARARAALAGLRNRHAADTELNAIATEAAELEQRLAALRAREAELTPATRKKTKSAAERDHDPAVVRAWAREQGIECNAIGRVPRAIVDQWRAATA